MIKTIVIDDEWAAGQWLGMQLGSMNQIQVVRILQNPLEVMECIRVEEVDVIFLDISMPEITGLELAEQISLLEQPPEVVFVTAYNDYALEAFRVNALDYLVKPIHEKELFRVLAKLKKRLGEAGEKKQRSRQKKSVADTMGYYSIEEVQLDFPTVKSEELFYYLLLLGRRPISKWELIEGLWPDREPEKGESNLRTTVFRVNQTLEQGGMELRVKASKGYYHFTFVSEKGQPVTIQPFPPVETLVGRRTSLVEQVEQYNFLQLIAEKDYLWAAGVKEYEKDYYRWAMELIGLNSHEEAMCLEALGYLLHQFPWQEQVILQSMNLLVKLEGRGALTHFYRRQEVCWETLYGIPLSKTLEQTYQSLIG